MMNLSIQWICNYVNELLNQQKLNERVFLSCKAISEFSLFAMLSKRYDSYISQDIRNQIQGVCLQVFREIPNTSSLMSRIDHAEMICASILLYTGKATNKELITTNNIKEILNRKQNNIFTLEQAYFHLLSGINVDPSSWLQAIEDILDNVSANGLTNFWLYQLTHFVFFSSDFGSLNSHWDYQFKFSLIIKQMLWLSCEKLKSQRDWDLLIEVIISIVCLNNILKIDNEKELIELSDFVFSESLSIEGWFSTNGSSFSLKGELDPKIISRGKYSLFHTTIVGVILGLMLSKGKSIDKSKTDLSIIEMIAQKA